MDMDSENEVANFAAEKANISRMKICTYVFSMNAEKLTAALNEAHEVESFDLADVKQSLDVLKAKGLAAEETKAKFLELQYSDISISELIALVKQELNLNASNQNKAA